MEKLTEIQLSYQDIRFGEVDIYVETGTENLKMLKTKKSETYEEHAYSKRLAQDRYNIQNENILRMDKFINDEKNLEIKMLYDYPNEDLYERKNELKNIKEFLKFFKDILQALRILEKEKMIHGDIKPEFIFFDRKTDNYILLDRLADASSPNQAQLNNLNNGENIYLSPIIFENLIEGNIKIAHNPFKSEIFSFGMICLSMLLDEENQLQGVYDYKNKIFDTDYFFQIINFVRDKYFSEGDSEILGDFLFFCILNLNPKERITPRKAYVILERTIGTFQQELKTLRNAPSPQITSIVEDLENVLEEEILPQQLFEEDNNIEFEQNIFFGKGNKKFPNVSIKYQEDDLYNREESEFLDNLGNNNDEDTNQEENKYSNANKYPNYSLDSLRNEISKVKVKNNFSVFKQEDDSRVLQGKAIETDSESNIDQNYNSTVQRNTSPNFSTINQSEVKKVDLDNLVSRKSVFCQQGKNSLEILQQFNEFHSEFGDNSNTAKKNSSNNSFEILLKNNPMTIKEESEQNFNRNSKQQSSKRILIQDSIYYNATPTENSSEIDFNYSKYNHNKNSNININNEDFNNSYIDLGIKSAIDFESKADNFFFDHDVTNNKKENKVLLDDFDIENKVEEKFFDSGSLNYNFNNFVDVNFFQSLNKDQKESLLINRKQKTEDEKLIMLTEKQDEEERLRVIKEKQDEEERLRILKEKQDEEERLRILKEKQDEEERLRVLKEKQDEEERIRILKEKQDEEERLRVIKEKQDEEERLRILKEKQDEEERLRILKEKQDEEERLRILKEKQDEEERLRVLKEKQDEEERLRILKEKQDEEERLRVLKEKQDEEERLRVIKEKQDEEERVKLLIKIEEERVLKEKQDKEERLRILKEKQDEQERLRVLKEKQDEEERLRILKEKQDEEERLRVLKEKQDEEERLRVIKEKQDEEERVKLLIKIEEERVLKEKQDEEERLRILKEKQDEQERLRVLKEKQDEEERLRILKEKQDEEERLRILKEKQDEEERLRILKEKQDEEERLRILKEKQDEEERVKLLIKIEEERVLNEMIEEEKRQKKLKVEKKLEDLRRSKKQGDEEEKQLSEEVKRIKQMKADKQNFQLQTEPHIEQEKQEKLIEIEILKAERKQDEQKRLKINEEQFLQNSQGQEKREKDQKLVLKKNNTFPKESQKPSNLHININSLNNSTEKITQNFNLIQKINNSKYMLKDNKMVQVNEEISRNLPITNNQVKIIIPNQIASSKIPYQNMEKNQNYLSPHHLFPNSQTKYIQRTSNNFESEKSNIIPLDLLLSKEFTDKNLLYDKMQSNNIIELNERPKRFDNKKLSNMETPENRNFGSKSPIRIRRITKEEYEESLKQSKSPNLNRPNIYEQKNVNIHFSKIPNNSYQTSEMSIQKPTKQYNFPVNHKNIDYFNQQKINLNNNHSLNYFEKIPLTPSLMNLKQNIPVNTPQYKYEKTFSPFDNSNNQRNISNEIKQTNFQNPQVNLVQPGNGMNFSRYQDSNLSLRSYKNDSQECKTFPTNSNLAKLPNFQKNNQPIYVKINPPNNQSSYFNRKTENYYNQPNNVKVNPLLLTINRSKSPHSNLPLTINNNKYTPSPLNSSISQNNPLNFRVEKKMIYKREEFKNSIFLPKSDNDNLNDSKFSLYNEKKQKKQPFDNENLGNLSGMKGFSLKSSGFEK